jgi:hypothetical protein
MRFHRGRSLAWLLVALCAAAFPGHAGAQQRVDRAVSPYPSPPPPPARRARPGLHRHDGFMARLTGGFGSGATSAQGSDLVGELERSQNGLAGSLSLDIGGGPVENLIVHGRLANHTIVSPDLTLDGRDLGEQERSSITAHLLGAGVSYYFMPTNLYATAAVGMSWLRFESSGGHQQYTYPGFGLNADVGKEWWIAADVGLGAAARFWYTRAEQEDAEIELEVSHDYIGWALLASFTWQ